MAHILLVEDDAALSRGIVLALQSAEQHIMPCSNLLEGRNTLRENIPDLFILDINLPDGSGLDFCSEIRRQCDIPILLLTANDTEMDIVTGLELGADDYITKPFSLAVLRARVNALLRRSGGNGSGGETQLGPFSFDFAGMSFKKNNHTIELSKTEQKLLQLLVNNRGITLSRESLLGHIWPDGSDYVEENALSVAVRRLRAKLEDDPGNPQYIKTVHGLGYSWVVAP